MIAVFDQSESGIPVSHAIIKACHIKQHLRFLAAFYILSLSGGEELLLQRFSNIYSADKLSCNAVGDLACY